MTSDPTGGGGSSSPVSSSTSGARFVAHRLGWADAFAFEPASWSDMSWKPPKADEAEGGPSMPPPCSLSADHATWRGRFPFLLVAPYLNWYE